MTLNVWPRVASFFFFHSIVREVHAMTEVQREEGGGGGDEYRHPPL
jgi:hypothetical protein